MKRNIFVIALAPLGLLACATSSNHHGTLVELEKIPADIEEVYVEDSLERAAESYQRYLQETPKSARTPEAMRRLADLQIEQAYGVIGSGEMMEMAVPDAATPAERIIAERQASHSVELSESEQAFEARATERETLLAQTSEFDPQMPGGEVVPVPVGPMEAIKTYLEILETYPNYERNDQVLYQLSRAYDDVSVKVDKTLVLISNQCAIIFKESRCKFYLFC